MLGSYEGKYALLVKIYNAEANIKFYYEFEEFLSLL